MRVHLQFFAHCRDVAGVGEADITLPENATLADLEAAVTAEHPGLKRLWRSLAFAVNEVIVRSGHPLKDGDRVALLPPIAGG